MKKHFGMVVLATLVALALLCGLVTYQVDQNKDTALVTRFGKVHAVVLGSVDPGLHFKLPWPIEKVVEYDSRTFTFDDADAELQTRDQQNIKVQLYCTWSIADPTKFYSSVETSQGAQDRLRPRLQYHKADVVGKHSIADFVNTDPTKMLISDIEKEILAGMAPESVANLGVKIHHIGIKGLGFNETVTAAVIASQKAEREQAAQQYRASAEAVATAIRERAKTASDQILAFASRKAEDIRTEGVRAAAEEYKRFAQNESLAIFLRTLESMKKELASKSIILLDGTEGSAASGFREGPRLVNQPAPSTQPAPAVLPAAVSNDRQR